VAPSLYDTLGVPKTASQDEIKKAYRKLARELHPDRNPGDDAAEARFKEVSAAYEVLKDAEKRQQYDRFGSANGRPGFDPGAAGFDFGNVDLGDLGDLFGGLFGGGRARTSRPRPEKGADLEAHVTVSFDDALAGVETRIPVEVTAACRTCHGSGAKPGTAPRICPECNGRGVKAESQGLFALSQPCPRCRGNGTVIDDPCATCGGSGRERRTKRYAVKIPAGARDGMRLRLRGKGEPGANGGPNGDLDVVVHVERSDTYERRGDDLVVDVSVSFPTAALGGTVEVPTPEGAVSLKVPAGATDGKLLRIRGRGAPRPKGSGKGDVLARLRIEVPKRVNKKERELLEELGKVL
jgi:molecular chaperone DnaJ